MVSTKISLYTDHSVFRYCSISLAIVEVNSYTNLPHFLEPTPRIAPQVSGFTHLGGNVALCFVP